MEPLFLQGKKKKLFERQDIPKTPTIKNTFAVKRYGKELLVQIKEEEVYKIITQHSQKTKTALSKK